MTLSNRTIFAVALALSLGLFAGGVVLGAWLHLAACPLCILQRLLYLLVAIIAGFGFMAGSSTWGRVVVNILLLVASGAGVFVAGYQSYLQRFPTGIGCAADSPWWEQWVYWAGQQVPLLFQANGICEDASWKLMGFSIAEYSLLAFLGLSVLPLCALLRRAGI